MTWALITICYINAIVMLTLGGSSKSVKGTPVSGLLCITGVLTLIVAFYATGTSIMAL